ncbi:hypothetical protein NEIRO02_0720 [Nematocida sp. AWRm79]|nr:hypothetical protein NEIRO02_0720 [Nematocida sp. AWRm79]
MEVHGYLYTVYKSVLSLYLIFLLGVLLIIQLITFPIAIINKKPIVHIMNLYNRHMASVCLFLIKIGNRNAIQMIYTNPTLLSELNNKSSSILIVSNHICAFDGAILTILSNQLGKDSRFVGKSALRWIPIIGWGMYLSDYLFVKRVWKKDCERIKKWCKHQKNGVSLVIYPEGSRYTEKKQKKSADFSISKSLPVLQNVLYPRTKGYNLCVNILPNPPFTTILNVTMVYLVNGKKQNPPSYIKCVTQRLPGVFKVIIEAERITESIKNAEYVVDKFKEKDVLINQYTSRC